MPKIPLFAVLLCPLVALSQTTTHQGGLTVTGALTGETISTTASGATEWKLFEDAANGNDYTSWRAPTLLGAILRYIMPETAPTAGQFFRSVDAPDGSGLVQTEWAGIASADLPTGIDAAKIADGSVTNAEFQRLDATSSIQTQLDGKQAIDSELTTLAGKTLLGNGANLRFSTGAVATDDCAKFDASGNIVSAGAVCGSGGGGPTIVAYTTSHARTTTGAFNSPTDVAGGALTAGDLLEFTWHGYANMGASSQAYTLEPRVGAVVLAPGVTSGTLIASSDFAWNLRLSCIVLTTGASGAFECGGTVLYNLSTTAEEVRALLNTTTVTVDTTAAMDFHLELSAVGTGTVTQRLMIQKIY